MTVKHEVRTSHSSIFGEVRFQLVTNSPRPGTVLLLDDFERKNLQTLTFPLLGQIPGAPLSGKIRFAAIAAPALVASLTEIHERGLWPKLVTFDGTFNPRLVRGSFDVLSQHALGLAIDLNAAWNTMGTPGAPAGAKGSLLDLVPIFESYGFTWGGRFHRPDPMHFEYTGPRQKDAEASQA